MATHASTSCAQGPVTRLIADARGGDADAANRLFRIVYEELRRLARQHMGNERAGHTLQGTALVHEAYLKLIGQDMAWGGRRQFFFAAAEAMRRILVDHARAHRGPKRGGGRRKISLSVLELASEERSAEILALDDALSRLEKVSPDVAAVVRLRFYGGLTIDETAETLGISARTVKREWKFARARLFQELNADDR